MTRPLNANAQLIAETSEMPYVGFEKILLFAFLAVYVWRDCGRRNYPIRLKFGTNVYVLCETSLQFLVNISQTVVYRDYKNISLCYRF